MGRLVYFIQADGPIKIGVAANPLARLRELQIAHYVDLKLLATATGDEKYEARLHERFAESRIRGEWFAPSEELLALIAHHDRAVQEAPMPSMEPLVIAEPISDICDRCGWPTQAELTDRGIFLCYACLKEEVPEYGRLGLAESAANAEISRRLADSNCCKVPVATAQPCGSRPSTRRTTDLVTRARARG